MGRCFIIQPFDGEVFDARCEDVIKPAIRKAGLEPYRIDEDHSVDIPIDAIHSEIAGASACIADISENNPNVWYELGYALALRKPTVIIKSDKRRDYPFDVQHRNILTYKGGSKRYLDKLEEQIIERLNALKEPEDAKQELVTDGGGTEDISIQPCEIDLIMALNSEALWSGADGVPLYKLVRMAAEEGNSDIDIRLALRRLNNLDFIRHVEIVDERSDASTDGYRLSEKSYQWMRRNADILRSASSQETEKVEQETFEPDDELPF